MIPESKDVAGTRSDGFKTSGYALSVNGGSTTNLTFDLNGNMTSDGTNSYAWDAENRMIKITYPGSNNFSTFVYDGLSRNVSIFETTAGSVTSTKQFVWNANARKEERDASGVLTKKFFARGQMNSTTKYFYDLDHLGSVREINDNTSGVQAQYAFDPYGQVTKLSETVPSDFGFCGYYIHARSGLNLTRTRAYNAKIGRFISRDTIEEAGGNNLFAYVNNSPESVADPNGTDGGASAAAAAAAAAIAAAAAEGAAEGAPLGPGGVIGGALIGIGIGVGITNAAKSKPKPKVPCFPECTDKGCCDDNFDTCTTWCDWKYRGYRNVACHQCCSAAQNACHQGNFSSANWQRCFPNLFPNVAF